MRRFHSNSAQRRDHYQELTDKIVAALEAGSVPWRRPWDRNACGGAAHSPEQRATVLLHELAHASGHKTRLNRDLSGGFGSASYSKEELRADITSCMVGSIIGLPCDIPNHASYIQSWIAVLKHDRREIFHAAAEAQRMADYILGFHPDYAEKPDNPVDDEDDGASSLAPPLAA
jgi:antirestriction protein ArdC